MSEIKQAYRAIEKYNQNSGLQPRSTLMNQANFIKAQERQIEDLNAKLTQLEAQLKIAREALEVSCWCGALGVGTICKACSALQEIKQKEGNGK